VRRAEDHASENLEQQVSVAGHGPGRHIPNCGSGYPDRGNALPT
jgi:hypothetical protein